MSHLPVDNFGTVVGENPDCLLLSGTVVSENPDHVCWAYCTCPIGPAELYATAEQLPYLLQPLGLLVFSETSFFPLFSVFCFRKIACGNRKQQLTLPPVGGGTQVLSALASRATWGQGIRLATLHFNWNRRRKFSSQWWDIRFPAPVGTKLSEKSDSSPSWGIIVIIIIIIPFSYPT